MVTIKLKLFFTMVILFFIIRPVYSQNVDSTDNYVFTFKGQSPIYNGDLVQFIKNNVRYPEEAAKDSIEGSVIVSLWIDTLGNTSHHNIVKGAGEELNKEALRVAKLIKFDKPAYQNGIPVNVQYFVPVNFELSSIKQQRECDTLFNEKSIADNIDKYLDLSVKINHYTVDFDSVIIVTFVFKNKANDSISFYPYSLLSVMPSGGSKFDSYFLRRNVDWKYSFCLKPNDVYKLNYIIQIAKPFFHEGINEFQLYYECKKQKGENKKYNKLYGSLQSNDFFIYVR